MGRAATLLATFLAFAAGGPTAGPQETGRAFVLDPGANVLVALDLAAGKRIAQVSLVGTPQGIQLSPDGRYLALLDRGPGEDKDERGYRATGKSLATIVDTATFKVVGRVVLGFGIDPGSSRFLPEGGMALLCPGYDAKDPKESLPRELVTFDLATARERGRLTLEPGTFIAGQSRDQRTLALLQGQPRTAKPPFPKSKIWLVDLTGPNVAATLDGGSLRGVMSVDERLYLVDPGAPAKDPQKNKNAAIDVVTLSERRVERLDGGWATVVGGGFDDLVVLASNGKPGGSTGELRAFRGGSLAATLAVAEKPKLIEKVRDALYVVGATTVTVVDPTTLKVSGTIPLVRGAEAIVGNGDHPFELVVTSDRRRAFIHYPVEDKVVVLDLAQLKAIGSTKTGRGGKKLFNGMMAGLTYGATDRTFYYNAGDPPQIQVRPDGRFAYVLNRDTSDVTIVDAETAQAVEKIGGGGYEVRVLGERVVVVGSEIQVIDAIRNAKVDEIRLPGLRGMLVSPDGAFAVALAERTVLILDGATGQERARLTDFVRPTRIAFAHSPVPVAP